MLARDVNPLIGIIDHRGKGGAGGIRHHEMLDLHWFQRVRQIVNRDGIVTRVGCIEARARVIDNGPAGGLSRICYRPNKRELSLSP